ERGARLAEERLYGRGVGNVRAGGVHGAAEPPHRIEGGSRLRLVLGARVVERHRRARPHALEHRRAADPTRAARHHHPPPPERVHASRSAQSRADTTSLRSTRPGSTPVWTPSRISRRPLTIVAV